MAAAVNEYEEIRLVAELQSRGYTVIKEKGLESVEPTKVTAEPSSRKLKQFDIVNITADSQESQDFERYTVSQIRQIFDYDAMIHDNPCRKQDIDSVMDILHTAMNTTRNTIDCRGGQAEHDGDPETDEAG